MERLNLIDGQWVSAVSGDRLVVRDPATDEEIAAQWAREHMKKPVVGFIAGVTAPPGKRMGHAGAIIQRGMGTAESKVKAFAAAKVPVAEYPRDIPRLIREWGSSPQSK